MTLLNELAAKGSVTKEELRTFIILLNPFAPHITEEMQEALGFEGMLNQQKWVTYDEKLCVEDTVEIVVQINGKLKSKLNISADASKDEMLSAAKSDEKVSAALEGANIVKEIVVPGKLVNFVVKQPIIF